MSVGVLQMLDAVIAADRINGRMDCVAVATGVRARALALERAAWRAELMLKHLCDSRLRGEIAAEAREDWRTLVDARAAFNGSAAPAGDGEMQCVGIVVEAPNGGLAISTPATPAGGGDDLVARLERSLRDLGEHRQTHVVWRDWLLKDPANEQVNPHAGSAKFHDDTIKDYDRHLAAIEEAIRRLASTSVQAPSAEWEATDADIAAWLHRHDLAGSLPGCDARAAFEDARSAHLSAAPTQEPPNG